MYTLEYEANKDAQRPFDLAKRNSISKVSLYTATGQFPLSEQFSLTSQMRRCAVSIPSNIAEGCGRHSNKELIRSLYITLGSATELETQVIISEELSFLNKAFTSEINNLITEIIKMTASLINSIKARIEVE